MMRGTAMTTSFQERNVKRLIILGKMAHVTAENCVKT